MDPESTQKKRFASVQRTLDGRLLGACIDVPAHVLVGYIDRGWEQVEFRFKTTHEGIMVVIGEDQA